MKTDSKIMMITMTSMMIVLSAILGFTPAGTITIGIVQITIAHLPVIVSALTLGFTPSLIVGASLGIISLLRATVMPTSPLDPFFINPLVSVLPRVMIPIFTYLVFIGLKKLLGGGFAKNTVAIAVSSAIGSITNTVLVLSILYMLYVKDLDLLASAQGTTAGAVLLGIATVNGVSEMVAITLLSTIIVLALQRAGLSRMKQ